MQSSNRVFKQELINLYLHRVSQKNNALKQLAVTDFVIKGDGGIKQFIKDWLHRRMKIKGEHHLGLSKSHIEELQQKTDIEIEQAVTERVETYFPGRSKQIYAAVSQYIAGFFTYALDQGLKCAHTDSQTISILQPKLEDTDIDLINDPEKPDDILCVCTFKKFEIAFFERPLQGYLEGPLTLVFRLTQISEDTYGFDFLYYETKNKLIDMIYHGELLTDELIVSEVIGPEESETNLFNSFYVVPKSDCFRFNNNIFQEQFNRDIYLLGEAMKLPGDTIGAEVLWKLLALIFYSEFYYYKNNAWHLWQDDPDHIPLAAIPSHGARPAIYFPASLSEAILQWLMGTAEERFKYRRYSATHGIEALPPDKIETINGHKKVLYESKKTLVEATMDTIYGFVPQFVTTNLQHYGFNLALGGDGSIHPLSNAKISSNGEHGHLYLCYNLPAQITDEPTDEPYAAILFGIEQSAPGAKHDQYGGKHTITGAHLNFTATGGDDFGKRPLHVNDDYQGLKGIGPDRYYDCFYCHIDAQLFEHIKMRAESFTIDMLARVGSKVERVSQQDIEASKAVELLKKQQEENLRKQEEELRKQQEEELLRRQQEELLQKQAELKEIEKLKYELNERCIDMIAANDELSHAIKTLEGEVLQTETSNNELRRERDALLREISELDKQKPYQPIEIPNAIQEQENQVAEQQNTQEQFEKYTLVQQEALKEVFSRLQQVQNTRNQLLLEQKATKQKLDVATNEQQEIMRQLNQARMVLQTIQQELQEAEQANQPIDENRDPGRLPQYPGGPPPDHQPEIVLVIANQPLVDGRSFWEKHWKKILFGTAIGAALVVGGVLTGGLVPIIAAGLGVSFGVAAAIGFGGAVVVGGALGAGAGYAAGAMPSREKPGVKAFLSRHKRIIIICGVAAAILIGGVFTCGILSVAGVLAGVGFLATLSTGVGAALAGSVGVSAGLTTAVTGAAIVTASAATIGTSTGIMIGALIDKNAKGSINGERIEEQIDRDIPQPPLVAPQPPKRKLFGNFFTMPSFSLTKLFHRNDPPRLS